ncbi:hypothetical protein LDL36_00130 [Komagataeibacter sp. FNDCR1]|uniref:Tetratricopeptide repeat-like domain-containing protein n=2 Tax=Gluconacetobacter entanii TaxID=108528 RepID=A0A318PU77_9PROT|nr:hypothetical protein [Gluconacetobacter entanii]MCE2576940.1 hypothetical protein [Komagataeibacter sp. FNDCR1]PYD64000.1 hypothetical protein CFR72_04265 [Gluconacetobacter entanii]
MRATYLASAAMVLLLAGCGGGSKVQAPTDSTLSQDMDTGRDAVDLDRLSVAEGQYRAAGVRALARDDVTAIGDAGYNLAVVQLDENKAQDALSTVASTRAALSVRGAQSDDTGLDLVQAGALYRLGRFDEAASAVALAARASDPAIVEKAQLLSGIIADARGDRTTLDSAGTYFAQLPRTSAWSWLADAQEIAARRLLVEGGDAQTAYQDAMQAVSARQTHVEYRDMARGLSVAARAAGQAGNASQAADLYMRASQSAQKEGDTQNADAWRKLAGTTSMPDPFADPTAQAQKAATGKTTAAKK